MKMVTNRKFLRSRSGRYVIHIRRLLTFLLIVIGIPALLIINTLEAFPGIGYIFKPFKTEITGISTSPNSDAGKVLKDKVTIKYADGRELYLEKYNSKKKTWVTKKTYKTPSKHEATITVKYPSDWGKTTKSKWRLRMKGSFLDSSYISKIINCVAYNVKDLNLTSAAAIAYDPQEKKILYAVNPHKRLPNASTTKLMTALVTLKSVDMDGVVTIQKDATIVDYAELGMKKGQQYNVEDMMYAMLLDSANDAAVAIADYVSGSVDDFADEMNSEAEALGCTNTHFVNPHGLDAYDHYSSAYDLALIDAADMEYSEFRKIILTKKYSFKAVSGSKDKITVENSNELLEEDIEGELGGKTGTTTTAGECLVNNFEYNGKKYITVVLNSKNRWNETKLLNEYIKDYAS